MEREGNMLIVMMARKKKLWLKFQTERSVDVVLRCSLSKGNFELYCGTLWDSDNAVCEEKEIEKKREKRKRAKISKEV